MADQLSTKVLAPFESINNPHLPASSDLQHEVLIIAKLLGKQRIVKGRVSYCSRIVRIGEGRGFDLR
jgi:hypothetical protein